MTAKPGEKKPPVSADGRPEPGVPVAGAKPQIEKKRNKPRAMTVTPDPTRMIGAGSPPTPNANGTAVMMHPISATNKERTRGRLLFGLTFAMRISSSAPPAGHVRDTARAVRALGQ